MRAAGTPRAVWIALGALLAVFLILVALAPSADLFGRIYFDDTMYFSTGKALADGEGFIIPSLPGEPPQTKYPILFPFALSLIWQWNPEFPANVETAAVLNGLFSCVFLAASFLYIRRFEGVSDWTAFGCVALSAVYPQFFYLTITPMSEPLFLALCMLGMLLAEVGLENRKDATVVGAGVAFGLAFLTRTAGVAFLPGALLLGLLRRDYRRTLLLGAACTPFVLGHFLWTSTANPAPAAAGAPQGWAELWIYTTSYADFYKLDVPTWDIFIGMLGLNFLFLLLAPAGLTLMQGFESLGSLSMVMTAFAISIFIWMGLIRQARSGGLRIVHVAMALSAGLSLVWNGPIQWRIMLVFLPIFYMGAWFEGVHVLSSVAAVFHRQGETAQKAIAGVLGALVVGAGLWIVGSRVQSALLIHSFPRTFAAGFYEHPALYEWVRENTSSDEVLLAFADARLYLETGRQAAWPLLISLGNFYPGQEPLESRYERFYDVAEHLRARYLVLSTGEVERDGEAGARKLAEIEARFPIAFQTPNKTVTVYDLLSLHQAASAARSE